MTDQNLELNDQIVEMKSTIEELMNGALQNGVMSTHQVSAFNLLILQSGWKWDFYDMASFSWWGLASIWMDIDIFNFKAFCNWVFGIHLPWFVFVFLTEFFPPFDFTARFLIFLLVLLIKPIFLDTYSKDQTAKLITIDAESLKTCCDITINLISKSR